MSEIQIPNQPKQILIVTKYELIKFVRGKKIHGLAGLAALISILFVVLPPAFDIDLPETANGYFIFPVGFVTFLLIISSAFFGGNSLASEFHNKTGYTLFPNPVSRTSIWLGKFFASELAAFLIIGIYYSIISIGALSQYGSLSFEIFYSFLFSLVVCTTVMSVAFLASALLRGPSAAIVAVFLLFILVLPAVDQLLILFEEQKPWFSPTFSSKIIETILAEQYQTESIEDLYREFFGSKFFVPDVKDSLLIMSVYVFACSVVSVLIFRRREITTR